MCALITSVADNKPVQYAPAPGVLAQSNGAATMTTGGSVTLGGTLDRLRITTVNGTDAYDAGTVNILYEG